MRSAQNFLYSKFPSTKHTGHSTIRAPLRRKDHENAFMQSFISINDNDSVIRAKLPGSGMDNNCRTDSSMVGQVLFRSYLCFSGRSVFIWKHWETIWKVIALLDTEEIWCYNNKSKLYLFQFRKQIISFVCIIPFYHNSYRRRLLITTINCW
jgi:hypothetical protein